jgi:NAD-dependent deacetylase
MSEEEQQVDMITIDKAAQMIANAKRIVVFTGAGASKDSGIGTFRGGSGLWTGPLGYVVLGWFGTPVGWRWTPGICWSQYIDKFYNPIKEAQPNAGHYAIAELANYFNGLKVITQNVDGLHQRAGNADDDVYEVHGTVRKYKCIAHGHPYDFNGLEDLPTKSPKCTVTGCNSTLRPDCVLFTESLPMDQWQGSENATRKLRRGDVMLIVGTSATVYPAASLPQIAAAHGAHIIDVNPEATNFKVLNNYHLLQGKSGEVLPQVVAKVKDIVNQQ